MKHLNNQKKKKSKRVTETGRLLATSILNLAVSNDYVDNIKEKLTQVAKSSDPTTTKRLHELIDEMSAFTRQQRIWNQFEDQFSLIHSDFLKRLREEYPTLTAQDIRLCAYLRIKLTTNEIARLLNVSTRGVEVARYRLRKRLNLETKDNLSVFLSKF